MNSNNIDKLIWIIIQTHHMDDSKDDKYSNPMYIAWYHLFNNDNNIDNNMNYHYFIINEYQNNVMNSNNIDKVLWIIIHIHHIYLSKDNKYNYLI